MYLDMTNYDLDSLKLREIILNTREPIVLKKFPLNWLCFQNGIEIWCKQFDKYNLTGTNFERISKGDSLEPQWERKRHLIKRTATEFLKEHSKDCDYWSGLNYKRRNELPVECTNGIDFSIFGFPRAADEATLWLNSKGANTPCHYDSYGCNIVVQVFGKKSWLLFPPSTPLTTTRIPYEESSIYCKENFYAPQVEIKEYIKKFKGLAHYIILEPNDVLIVPKHWWHYVEAVDISLSVNAWIPLKCDLDQQIEECIIKYLIERFLKDCTTATQKHIMNPNQLMTISTKEELFEILEFLLNKYFKNNLDAKKEVNMYDYNYLNDADVKTCITDLKYIENVPLLTSEEFEKYLKANSLRFDENFQRDDRKCLDSIEEILINSICSPSVIHEIKNEFFKRYKLEVGNS